MSLQDVAQIGQIVSTLGTVAAVSIAAYVALRSARELNIDRRLRFHPVLTFEPGGYGLKIKRREFHHRIGGIQPGAVEESFQNFPPDGLVIDNEIDYGQLRNIGVGPAFDTRITWIPTELEVDNDKFTVDGAKLAEPRYSEAFNSMPSDPRIIQPGTDAQLTRVPTFLFLDFNQRFKSISGTLSIQYKDIAGHELETQQEFYIWTNTKDEEKIYGVTFGTIEKLPTIDQMAHKAASSVARRRGALAWLRSPGPASSK